MAENIVAENAGAEAEHQGIENIFAEIMGSAETEEEKVEQETEDAQEPVAGDDNRNTQRTFTQKDIDRAVSNRLASERKKHEKDPMLALGKAFAEQYGGDVEKAREALLNSRVEELSKDPKALAKAVLERDMPKRTASDEDEMLALAEELQEIVPGAKDAQDILAVHPDFIKDVKEYGPKAAVKMLRLTVKKADVKPPKPPQTIRPTNSSQSGNISVWEMSPKQFAELDRRLKHNR